MDITVVFSGDRLSQLKRRAIEIANKQGAIKKDDLYTVKFKKNSQDLLELLDLCGGWKLSRVFINDDETTFSDVYDVLTCTEKNECDGRCDLLYPHYVYLINEIDASIKNDDFDADSIRNNIAIHDSFEKQPDGSFKINKVELKHNIEEKYTIPMNICEKFDLRKIFKQIDGLPDFYSIPQQNDLETGGSSIYDDEDAMSRLTETAEFIAPIFAKVVAKEIDKVIVANFGTEKNAIECSKKAEALFSLERYDESLELFNKALEMAPTNSKIWYRKGILLEVGFEKYENAIDAYNRALDIDSNNLLAFWSKGDCFKNLGKEKEAIEIYEKSIELYEERLKKNPNDESVKEALQLIKNNLGDLKE